MSFEREIEKDMKSNFFNEFANNIIFSGIRLKAIKSYKEFEKKYSNKNPSDTGLSIKGMIVTVRSKDLPLRLETGDKVTVDDEKYEIRAYSDKMGMTKIDLETIEG